MEGGDGPVSGREGDRTEVIERCCITFTFIPGNLTPSYESQTFFLKLSRENHPILFSSSFFTFIYSSRCNLAHVIMSRRRSEVVKVRVMMILSWLILRVLGHWEEEKIEELINLKDEWPLFLFPAR